VWTIILVRALALFFEWPELFAMYTEVNNMHKAGDVGYCSTICCNLQGIRLLAKLWLTTLWLIIMARHFIQCTGKHRWLRFFKQALPA